MVTTIQLNENVKRALERLKVSNNDTYENVIVKMMLELDKQRRKDKDLLIEGCKEMAKDDLAMVKEFEHVDAELDWEWNEN